jgi:hypothetical protein
VLKADNLSGKDFMTRDSSITMITVSNQGTPTPMDHGAAVLLTCMLCTVHNAYTESEKDSSFPSPAMALVCHDHVLDSSPQLVLA